MRKYHTHTHTQISATDTVAMTKYNHVYWYGELHHHFSHSAKKQNALDKSDIQLQYVTNTAYCSKNIHCS
jgi:hypothetical protein